MLCHSYNTLGAICCSIKKGINFNSMFLECLFSVLLHKVK